MILKIKIIKVLKNLFFPVVLLLNFFEVSAKANYLRELINDSKIIYQHWDVNSNKVSGYSYFSYEKIMKEGDQFFLEKNENTKPDGEIFTRKTLWFNSSSGNPKRYEEQDYRKDFRIVNIYLGKKIKTNLYKSGKNLEFETYIDSENTVSLELFFFFLRKKFQEIIYSDHFYFTLFIPLIAIELEEKGLPRSMSMLEMVVEVKEETAIKSVLGTVGAVRLLVLPRSALLRALLPKEKTNFEFLIGKDPPHYIIQFKVGKTKHLLREIIYSN